MLAKISASSKLSGYCCKQVGSENKILQGASYAETERYNSAMFCDGGIMLFSDAYNKILVSSNLPNTFKIN